MRLGRLLWWTEGPQQALPYLEQAYRQPDHSIWFYEALCDSLIKVGRHDHALAVAEHWQARAAEMRDPQQQARAACYKGRSHLARANTDTALACFMEGCSLYPGGQNAYEAGILLHARGEDQKALMYFDQFLTEGTGERAQYVQRLRKRILGEGA
jgi:tetratricopeptide (TPR) repeat protein